MLTTIRRTLPIALILLIMPVTVWMTGWQWQPVGDSYWLRLLFGFTETVSKPWGIVTHILLCGWIIWSLRYRQRAAIKLFFLLSITVWIGQTTKSWIKPLVQEPRPYVVWLEHKHQVPVNHFYNLKRHERAALVKSQLRDESIIPHWLGRHWQHEVSFAFPSGHSLFASCWALLAAGLLWPRRRLITVVVITVWAIMVMASRLALGMHSPADLIAATLISWLFATLACYLVPRLCGPLMSQPEKRPEVTQTT